MRQSLGVALVLCSAVSQAGAQPPPKAVVTGLTNPESVAVNTQGQVFVSVIGERDRDGDGAVLKIADPNGLQVLKCRVSVRRHFCHPSSFQGRGCENGRSTEDPASES